MNSFASFFKRQRGPAAQAGHSRTPATPAASLAVRQRACGPVLERLESRVLFSVFTVTNTLDTGDGSLRQAILDANASPGADTVAFALPGAGVQTIAPASPLPAITDTLTLDGTTQAGYAGRPLVEINGAAAGLGAVGLEIDAPGSSVTGLAVNGFSGAGIHLGVGSDSSTLSRNFLGVDATGTVARGNGKGALIDSPGALITGNLISGNAGDGVAVNAAGATIQGNFVGTDVTGSLALGNHGNGVYLVAGGGALVGGLSAGAGNVVSANFGSGLFLRSSSNVVAGNFIGTDATGLLRFDAAGNRLGNQGNGVNVAFNSGNNMIGGSTAARNVISGNFGNGVTLGTGSAPGNTVRGNFVGTDATGFAADGNGGDGVLVRSAGAVIGGASSGEGNVLSANDSDGLDLASGGTVLGNFIGTAADGATPLGNANAGVFVNGSGNTIGAVGAGANVIAFNGGTGVTVFTGTANSIRGNAMYANAKVGIDLGLDGVTLNDADGHAGPNNYQNFPVLGALTNTRSGLSVAGTLDADPSASFTIDFYTSAAADPSGYGQGQVWLGSVTVTTDAAGHASFSATFASPAQGQGFLSATATDAQGNTSEFALTATVPPLPPPAPTLTGLSSSLNPAVEGQAVTFTATISVSGASGTSGTAASGTPTGTVTFMDGQTVLGTAAVGASGTASFTTSALSVGGHTITAVYSGDADFVASTSDPLAQTITARLATLGGHVWFDGSDTGLSGSLTPMAGVTVLLYQDQNGNGRLDGGDGAPVASTVSAADGSYSFANLPAGEFFVKEVVPAGYVLTAPSPADFYAANTAGGASAANLDFANFYKVKKHGAVRAQNSRSRTRPSVLPGRASARPGRQGGTGASWRWWLFGG